jgi:hypothetical protein
VVVTRARAEAAPRVALAAEHERAAQELALTLSARGIPVDRWELAAAVEAPVGVIAYVPREPPTPPLAAKLAPLCAQAAQQGRPVVILCAFERARGKTATDRAAALSYLRTYGAVVTEDPDVWIETCALLGIYGAPPGPRVAVVAPEGSVLYLQAVALALEEEARGVTRTPVSSRTDGAPPTDVVLVDAPEVTASTPEHVGQALVVPVACRGECLGTSQRPPLVGLRAARQAAILAGLHAVRLAAGLGPAPASDTRRLKIDRERADKALAHGQVSAQGERLGDHESKLLLSAYGVPVTRQGVASTPSAAVRIAQTCGWPVELKPWDPGVAAEPAGPLPQVGLRNPPDVRRAFASAATAAGLKVGVPMIVRVPPLPGRELAAHVAMHPELGWTLTVDAPGSGGPLCAPAPLRQADAEAIAATLEASRLGDAAPDRAALAELLLRASHVVTDRADEVESLELSRIVVSGKGALVVDARTKLRRKKR